MEARSLDEGVWSRAKADAARVYHSSAFVVATVILDALFGAVAVVLTADPQLGADIRAAVTLLAILVGTVVAVLSVLGVQWAAAPYRQRDESRQRERQLIHAAPSPEMVAANEQREHRLRELRVAVARISEELELNLSVLASNSSSDFEKYDRTFFRDYRLADLCWKEYGGLLAEHGFHNAHKAGRSAYRLVDDVNRSIDREYGAVGGVVQTVSVRIDEAKAQEALQTCGAALSALEAIPTSGETH